MDICPKCGVKSAGGHICAGCAGEMHPQRKVKQVRLAACSVCRRIQTRSVWREAHLADAIRDGVRKALKGKKIRKMNLSIDGLKFGPGLVHNLNVLAEIRQGEIIEVPVAVSITTCTACGREGGQYFEGVLQLRNTTPEVIAALYNQVGALRERGVFINNEVKVKTGFDFYMTSQKHLQAIARRLQKEFGGTLKVAEQLFTHDKQRSRDLYRVNAVLTFPTFSKGSVIVHDGRPIHVTKVGKVVSGVNLKTAKRVSIDSKKLGEVEVLQKTKSKILMVYPNIKIMHPETFDPMDCVVSGEIKIDQTVKIVLFEGVAYVL